MPRFQTLFFIFFLFSCTPANSYQDGRPQSLPLEALSVETAGGTYKFQVQIAQTVEQKQIGLMFRNNMPAGEGMLFTYKYPEVAGFWMRNTYISLDILFVRGDGTIANIARNTTPLSLDMVSSNGHIIGVLEINGGLAEKLGIEPGDKILHPFFQGKEAK
ncbi:MAG: DUF192 domain-containing protein [Sphingomonadales bacterium]